MPYSGHLNLDGHEDHVGAYPADVYYGDVVNETGSSQYWTDNTLHWDPVNCYGTHIVSERNRNVIGDGKFDQDFIPTKVEVQIGRIDFKNLTGAFPLTEVQLLQRYFSKNHNYRHKITSLQASALNADLKSWLYWAEWSPTAVGWGRFPGLLNNQSIGYINNTVNFMSALTSVERQFYLIANTSQGFDQMDNKPMGGGVWGKYLASDFAANDLKAHFGILLASYIGDWDTPNNFLRSTLGCTTYTLTAVYGNPFWVIHPLGAGATWGECALLTQNNTGVYQDRCLSVTTPIFGPVPPSCPGLDVSGLHGLNRIHISLLGDPTLRLHPVKPISNLTPTTSAGTVNLTWAASTETDLEGYYVYRSVTSGGPFTRISGPEPIPAGINSFAEPIQNGTYYYMVRAVQVQGPTSGEVPSSGYYTNLSQGITTTVSVTGWANWQIQDLGTLGGYYSVAHAINTGSKIAGDSHIPELSYDGVSQSFRAFKWENGYLYELGYVSASEENNYGYGINDNDVIVGMYNYAAGVERAFKWEAGFMNPLSPLLGSSSGNSSAYAVNNNGYVVGYSVNDVGASHAVRWNPGVQYPIDLGSLAPENPARLSFAYSINAAGKIVGKAQTVSGVYHGFRTVALQTINPLTDDIGTMSGNAGHASEVQDINDSDELVGMSQNSGGQYRAFRKTAGTGINAGFRDLGTLGGNYSVAYSINTYGKVVGNARKANGVDVGFVHYPAWTVIQDLNLFLPPEAGWDIRAAYAINDSGKIVGWGYKSGVVRGFVITPSF